jgi:VWFA-related protein
MHRRTWMVCLGVVVGLGVALRAGAPAQDPPPLPRAGTLTADEFPTFKTGTRLAVIDAVVVDDQGRHVTDLSPTDFEVVERGNNQKVRQAVYVRVVNPDGSVVPATVVPGITSPAAAPTRSRPLAAGASSLASPARAGRVIAIVVDDLGLSFESTAYVRQMLSRYVDSTVAPGDLVAIIRTAGGVGTLQQFTTDRRLLHSAIDRVRWSMQSRSGVGAFAPVVPDSSTMLPEPKSNVKPYPTEPAESDFGLSSSPLKIDPDVVRRDQAAAGTLGALEYVLRGIAELPGRKSVVFVSEGLDLGIRDNKSSRVWSTFTRVMDRANRSGVVVYAIDARGLQTGLMTADDDPQTPLVPAGGGSADVGASRKPIAAEMNKVVLKGRVNRTRELFDSQESLVYLAEQTGGFAVLNTNDLAAGMARVVDDTRGYYLLGFDTLIPNAERWDPNDVRVRVKRPGLRVRARRGLFGPADPKATKDAVVADPLVAAALSPFSSGDIDVRLTTLFAHDAKTGSYVRSLFYIDPSGLTFTDGPDGRRDTDVTLLLLAIGDNGQAVSQLRRQLQLRLTPEEYRVMRERGLLYSVRLPMKTPGGFQVRAAVQDARSRMIGTSTQYVEVPKVGKGQLALSGVVMMDVAVVAGGTAGLAADTTAPLMLATDTLADGVLGEPAIKIFKPGSEVAYTCEIYDGQRGTRTGFATTATLLRDGKPIFTSPPAPVTAGARGESAPQAIPVGGRLSLGRQLSPGAYTLQVSVAPAGAPGRARATQWAEFEVR